MLGLLRCARFRAPYRLHQTFFCRRTASTMSFVYPQTLREETLVEKLHGVDVADPYRWLEDPDAEETVKWVDAQNEVTQGYLQKSSDTRSLLFEEFKKGVNYERIGCPWTRGSNYFYNHNSGLQNQSVMYILRGGLSAQPEVFLDPNTLSEDGTKALKAQGFSESGKWMAYGVTSSGSDWETIFVKNVDSGEVLADRVDWCKFTDISWTHDDLGFFYTRYPTPPSLASAAANNKEEKIGAETTSSLFAKLFYHKIGTSQSEDLLVYEFPENPEYRPSAEVSDDGKFIIITVTQTCDPVNLLYISSAENLEERLKSGKGLTDVDKVVDNLDFGYNYLTNEGQVFWFRTNRNAPCYKVVKIDLGGGGREWVDVVPEHPEKQVLDDVRVMRDNLLICVYLRHVTNVFRFFSLETGDFIREMEGPQLGMFANMTGRKHSKEMFYYFMNMVVPGMILRVNLTSFETTVWREISVAGHNSADYEVKQVFYESKDKTKIPMFIVHSKSLPLDGSAVTRLYGYGGFNISLTPSFSCFDVSFVKLFRGVLAIPNLRGGGEYGEEWHKAGTKERKQNVFDDFIAAAEYLIAEKYTSKDKLFIAGGSNGGLLVSACLLQRPDLFAAVVGQVGVLDMLRFHKFTIGHAWTSDYGCADIKDEFEFLYKYSPVHNVPTPPTPDFNFPALLLTTADHDDRVVPLHSYKFIAAVQEKWGGREGQKNPLLIRIDVKAGHGAGKPISKRVEELADIYTFISAVLNVKPQIAAA